MNKQEYLIITFHSLDDAMDLDAKQTASMKDVLFLNHLLLMQDVVCVFLVRIKKWKSGRFFLKKIKFIMKK